MQTILVLAIAFVVYLYVLAPLQPRRKLWMSADPQFRNVGRDDPAIPPTASKYFERIEAALAALGFVPTGCVINTDTVPGITAYVAFFENRATGERSAATALTAPRPGGAVQWVQTVEFCAEFEDGTEVDTTNNVQPPSPGRPAWRHIYPIPRGAAVAELLGIHRLLVARHGGERKPLPPANQHAERLRQDFLREAESRVAGGWWYLDAPRRQYRRTLKDAYLGVWSHLWPAGALRRRAMIRRAEALRAAVRAAPPAPVAAMS